MGRNNCSLPGSYSKHLEPPQKSSSVPPHNRYHTNFNASMTDSQARVTDCHSNMIRITTLPAPTPCPPRLSAPQPIAPLLAHNSTQMI